MFYYQLLVFTFSTLLVPFVNSVDHTILDRHGMPVSCDFYAQILVLSLVRQLQVLDTKAEYSHRIDGEIRRILVDKKTVLMLKKNVYWYICDADLAFLSKLKGKYVLKSV